MCQPATRFPTLLLSYRFLWQLTSTRYYLYFINSEMNPRRRSDTPETECSPGGSPLLSERLEANGSRRVTDRAVVASDAISRSTNLADSSPLLALPIPDDVDLGEPPTMHAIPLVDISVGRPSSEDTQVLDEEPTRRRRDVCGFTAGWWWWWDIAAAALSFTAVVLLLVLLVKNDGRPLESWKLPIQPSS